MTMQTGESRRAARLAAAREHVRLENLRDLEGILGTFGEGARYIDEPWDEHHVGLQQVRGHYERLVNALPDLHIEITREYATEEAAVLELTVRGTPGCVARDASDRPSSRIPGLCDLHVRRERQALRRASLLRPSERPQAGWPLPRAGDAFRTRVDVLDAPRHDGARPDARDPSAPSEELTVAGQLPRGRLPRRCDRLPRRAPRSASCRAG